MYVWFVMFSVFIIPILIVPFFGGLYFRPNIFKKLIFVPAVLEFLASAFLLSRFLPDYFSGRYHECISDPLCMYEDPSGSFGLMGIGITIFLVLIAFIINKVAQKRFDPLNDPYALDQL